MNDAIDKGLIIKLRKGKIQAFDSLFRKYSGKLYSFIFSYTGSHEDTEDITQEVFFKVWQNRENLNPDLSFNAYIIVIARNLVLNLFKKRARGNKYIYLTSRASRVYNQTEDYIIFSELRYHSNVSVEKLPTRCKQIFMLSRQNGLSVKEIAEKLSISPSTVENQINKALKLIRKDLGSKEMLAILMIIGSL
ncbi:RNA polymerase sigma-70 factor [Fulvivirgaceae bacterium BMA10]|uniref:RNA polymerase sigma-70 factor n=1 Tax=Splendidivirga corallicola TaxID=3051826 RepID=A0ABT8KQ69_9BACT|nr:RNA polymerase sigma-70 factor [Fulvivirgaceae bacterium BMA10]